MINMKKQVWRTGALCLAGVVALSVAGVSVYAKTSEKKETEIKEQIQDAVDDIWKTEDTTAASIDETVYVILDADGTQQKIYVSDWLKNQGDKESYTQSTPDKDAPISVKITYTLDGKEISPADLNGKSGHVVIRYDYTNELYEMREIAGKEEKIYVPFAVMTGMILDNENFSNIQVSSGKVINDGSHCVVTGIVFPGLGTNLDMEEDLDDYLEIEADATDFTMNESYCIATNSIFSKLDLDNMDDLDDLKDAMNDLDDATRQLMDGSSDLYDGVAELYDKSGDLQDGVKELLDGSVDLRDGAYQVADGTVSLREGIGALQSGAGTLRDGTKTLQAGATDLSTGLTTLDSKSTTLVAGATQVFNSLLDNANSQLAAYGVTHLTIGNYKTVLDATIAQLSGASSASGSNASTPASQSVPTSPAAPVIADNSAEDETLTDVADTEDTTDVDHTATDDTTGVDNTVAADDTTDTDDTTGTADIDTASDLNVTADNEDNTADVISEEATANTDNTSEEETPVNAEEEVTVPEAKQTVAVAPQAAPSSSAGQQPAALSNESTIATLRALEGSLDNYNTFYQGLLAYTAGVSSANAGATKLAAGTTQVVDGANKLVSGSDDLFKGADTLVNGAKDLANGSGTLANGVTTLSDGSDKLIDGVSQLRDGAKKLKDGIVQFNDEGISKLTELDTDELQEVIDRMKATASVSENYDSFTGSDNGMNSSVKFIYKINAVK